MDGHIMIRQKFTDGAYSHIECACLGITVHSGGYKGKCNALAGMLKCKLQ